MEYEMLKLTKPAVFAALCMAIAPLVTRAAPPDILAQIPDDATTVVVIPNIAATEAQVQNYATQMGKALPHDLIGAALQNMGVNKGFNRGGSVGLVVVKMPAPKEGETRTTQPIVLLLPTTDPAAMLANLAPTAPDHGISTVTLPNQTENGYVATVGKFVAAAQDKEVLATFLAHKGALSAANPNMLKTFEKNDLVVYSNIAIANDMVGQQIDQWTAMIRGMALAGGQQLTKEQKTMQNLGFQMISDGAKKFLAETQTSLVTARLNNDGATIGLSAFFKPGSDLAKFAAGQSTAKLADLTGLPSGTFLAAGANTWDSATTNDIVSRIADELISNPDMVGKVADIKKRTELEKQMIAISSGARFVVQPGPDNDLKRTTATIIVDSNNPEKLQELFVQAIRMPDDADPDILKRVDVDTTSEVIKKVQLTKYTIKMSMRAETADNPIAPEKKQALEKMLAFQGPKGFVLYSGVTNKKLAILFGSDLKVVESELVAVQTNSSALGIQGDIGTLTPALVQGRSFVLYLPVQRWAQMAEAATQPTTAPAGGIALGGAALPIAISGATTTESVTGEVLIPRTLIIDLAERYAPLLGGGGLP
jgi:hypothetical protein